MTEVLVASPIIPKVLNLDNYEKWRIWLKTYLIAQNLWDVVEPNDEPPKEGPSVTANVELYSKYEIRGEFNSETFEQGQSTEVNGEPTKQGLCVEANGHHSTEGQNVEANCKHSKKVQSVEANDESLQTNSKGGWD